MRADAAFTRFTTCGQGATQGATPRCDAEVRRKVRRQLARARAGSRRPFIVLVLKAVSQPGWIRMDSASLSQPGMDSAETLKNTIGVRCQRSQEKSREVKRSQEKSREVKRSKFKSV